MPEPLFTYQAIGLLAIITGFFFRNFSATNRYWGYRSARALQSESQFRKANHLAGNLIILAGIVLFIVGLLISCYWPKISTTLYGISLIILLCTLSGIIILITEKNLRK